MSATSTPGTGVACQLGFFFDQTLQAHAQVGDDRGAEGTSGGLADGRADGAQTLAFEQREPPVVVKAAVGADQPQAHVAWQIAEQVEGEAEEVVGAVRVAPGAARIGRPASPPRARPKAAAGTAFGPTRVWPPRTPS